MAILRAQGLAKRYGGRWVVDGVDLELAAGEIVGLLGPNGAGKTTCFYLVAGLVGCDRGEIWLDQRELTRLPMHRRARLGLGYLPQEASVFRKLSVADNLRAVLELQPGMARALREQRLDALLDELEIGHLRDQPGISLSGGERRRVEIARALASEPRFLLLDEPFAGIDPIAVLDLQHNVGRLAARGIGVLITDHNVRETLGICRRAYVIHAGRVIAQGAPEAIAAHTQVRSVYLGEGFRL